MRTFTLWGRKMALQFILGNSGCGKTEYMMKELIVEEAVKNPKKNYLVIVPEQFTMQTQKKLVELSPNGAIMNIDVLSFKRLAYRVFDELGINDIEVLEETGKNIVLKKLAIDHLDELSVLKPNINRMGYISEVKSLLSEFVQYNITPAQLSDFINSDKLSPVLKAKLSDVLVMYNSFKDYMHDRYITAEEILNVLIECSDKSEMLKNSVIAFDEFTGFTPIQNQLMEKLLKLSDMVYVSVAIDSKEDMYHSRGMQELFDMPKKTISLLMKIANRCKVEVLEPVIMDANYRFTDAPELHFMEQNLFRLKSNKYTDKPCNVQITNVKSPRDELTAVARKINDLVHNHNYRYKDIAIVSGDIDTYSNYAPSILGRYNIPYFLDTTKEILFHPFIEFIRAVIDIAVTDFSYSAVLRFLRCGFCDIEENDIDILENYLLATGIRTSALWEKRWLRTGRKKEAYDLNKLNELRIEIYDLLAPFYEVFKEKESNVSRKIFAIYDLCINLSIAQKLAGRSQEYQNEGQQIKAKEYEQIYEIVMSLFEKYVQLLGDEILSIEEFKEVLDAGFDAAEVATIPPGYDNVILGDIERTRLNGVKILFFVGVNDGIVPKSAGKPGIISQYEREMLKSFDIELAPGAREQSFIQRYYLYINMTKPSQKLYISYSRTGSDGKSSSPSYLIGTIKRMFPELKEEIIDEIDSLPDTSTIDAAREYLLNGPHDNKWYEIARWFKESDTHRKEFNNYIEARYLTYKDDPISKVVAHAIYGDTLKGSVTRLEQFSRCAYSHYLKYGLKLKEREEYAFLNVDIGNIYHDALYKYSIKLKESEFDWFNVPDEKREELSEASINEAVGGYYNLSAYETAANQYQVSKMQKIFGQTVWALTEQVRRGEFIPTNFEVSFEEISGRLDESEDVLAFDIGEKEKIQLTGRIDRVDEHKSEETGDIYVKVIDYKSGAKDFNLVELYRGRQLQLVVYLNAAIANKELNKDASIKPGAILYYHIDEPVIKTDAQLSDKELEKLLLKELIPSGMINGTDDMYLALDNTLDVETNPESDVIKVKLKKDGTPAATSQISSEEEFEIVREFANTKIKEIGRRIYDGEIRVSPVEQGQRTSCSYCPYEAVCKINSKIPGLNIQKEESINKKEILEIMEKDIALEKSKGR